MIIRYKTYSLVSRHLHQIFLCFYLLVRQNYKLANLDDMSTRNKKQSIKSRPLEYSIPRPRINSPRMPNFFRLSFDHRYLIYRIDQTFYTGVVKVAQSKVFCNFIGWAESANGKNSWVTSLSYARDRAPKVLINYAALGLQSTSIWPSSNGCFLKLYKESCQAWG